MDPVDKTYTHFSRDTLMALYLLLRALRQGADVIELTESFFRSYWNCERPARLYEAYIRDFVRSVNPFFFDCYYRHYSATLYVNKAKAEEVEKHDKIIRDSLSSHTVLKPWPTRPKLKTETVASPPEPNELNEKRIAEEVRESLIKYAAIKTIIPSN
jgi:hypothetical protein